MFTTGKSLTQKFIDIYKTLLEQYKDKENVSEEHLYKEAIDILNKERQLQKENVPSKEPETINLSSTYREARKKINNNLNIKVRDIFH